MRVSVLITKKRDPELYALYAYLGKRSFCNIIKDALRWVVRYGYKGKIQIPTTSDLISYGLNNTSDIMSDKIHIALCFSSEKDIDIQHLLSSVKSGLISVFIKQTTKLYIGSLGLITYLNEDYQSLALNTVPSIVYSTGSTIEKTPVKKKQTKPRKQKKKDVSINTNSLEDQTLKNIETSPKVNIKVIKEAPVEKPNTQIHECGNTNDSYTFDNQNNDNNDNNDTDVLALLNALIS